MKKLRLKWLRLQMRIVGFAHILAGSLFLFCGFIMVALCKHYQKIEGESK
jgi:hypothetical protein